MYGQAHNCAECEKTATIRRLMNSIVKYGQALVLQRLELLGRWEGKGYSNNNVGRRVDNTKINTNRSLYTSVKERV